MEYSTLAGNYYTITSKSGCSVTDATGTLNETVEAGKQLTVQAPSDKLIYDDEQAIVFKANFNCALAALGLLGGGTDKLPAGYVRADFLESTGTQYIMTGFFPDDSAAIELDVTPVAAPEGMSIWLFANADAGRTEAGRAFKVAVYPSYLYFEFGDLRGGGATVPAYGIRRNMALKNGLGYSGLENYEFSKQIFKDRLVELSIFRNLRDKTVTTVDIYSCRLSKNSKTERYFIPALAPTGTPCMFDTVTRKPFYNDGTGSFIVGLTLSQARKLGKLPSTGGELTISLPSNWQEDEGVITALATAEGNGWVLTYQTYEAEGALSTFALRRLWVRRTQDENGGYVAADGSRWQVEWCAGIVGADPEERGYEPFRSVDAAVAYWQLAPYVDPNAEELLTETE